MSIYSLFIDTPVEVKVNLFINDMVPLENADMVRLSMILINKKHVPIEISVSFVQCKYDDTRPLEH